MVSRALSKFRQPLNAASAVVLSKAFPSLTILKITKLMGLESRQPPEESITDERKEEIKEELIRRGVMINNINGVFFSSGKFSH